MKEPLLEPLLRQQRLRRVVPVIERYPGCRLLDFGCGWEAKLLKTMAPRLAIGVGIDRQAPAVAEGRITTIQCDLEGRLPLESDAFDVVTMLAVLEHLGNPEEVLLEIRRVLRPGGSLALTVPSHAAKPVLEFLAFRVGIVNPREIADHKRYWNRRDLAGAAAQAALTLAEHSYFQFGFNNFAVMCKPPA